MEYTAGVPLSSVWQQLDVRKKMRCRVEEYVQLLSIARKILQILVRHPRINDNASLTMMHLDLHLHNIFVDPNDATIITAFID
ncbi:hypothetical protein D6C89_10881 [Aureobasidium pullulans]|nr:hypothetical protein D6C89_10881 [Aureobasidium pullulans]